jgi:hypothetical protein
VLHVAVLITLPILARLTPHGSLERPGGVAMRTRWWQLLKLRCAGGALFILWLFAGAGCALYPPVPTQTPPEQAPAAPVPSGGDTGTAPRQAATAALPAPETPPLVDTVPPEVVMLFNPAVPAHVEVARRLEGMLSAGPWRLRSVPLDEAAALEGAREPPSFAPTDPGSERYAVAVGLEAAAFALTRLRLPTVFCQVFNYGELLDGAERAWGVASIPPLELQLLAWKRLDPTLGRVGLIVAEDHDELVLEALQAGRRTSVSVQYEISTSDRQTLYHFRRLAREVDGIWLVPDNRILSPTVISELLSEARTQHVQLTAVNARSLPRGVLMSASATPTDVAETVSRVLARLVSGDTDGLALLTPLSDVAIEVDLDMAALFGLDGREAAWSVSHER